jgi:hypothetical protein
MKLYLSILLLLLWTTVPEVLAQSIIHTQHNLSVTGTGEVRALSESEICIFCHTPHNSLPSSPLEQR